MAFETRQRPIDPAGPRRVYVVEYKTASGTRRERVIATDAHGAIARAQRVFGGRQHRVAGRAL